MKYLYLSQDGIVDIESCPHYIRCNTLKRLMSNTRGDLKRDHRKVTLPPGANTSSNSSSNNGVIRERVDSTYCGNGYCERPIDRRNFRDDDRRSR